MKTLLAACAVLQLANAQTLRDTPLGTSYPPLYLDGPTWTASEPTLGLHIPATIPGDVITDLQRAAVIGDPWYELNFLDNRTLWDGSTHWAYATNVTLPPPGSPPGSTLLLVFEGIKMGARVSFNGIALGNVTNQFVRYTFPLPPAAVVQGGGNLVEVTFDPSLSLYGRYCAASGGWDWEAISQLYINDTVFGVSSFYSEGIWKSVYIAAVPPANSVAITALVPLTRYLGAYPVGALVDGAHGGFNVNVTTHVWAPEGGATGTLTVAGSWGASSSTPTPVAVPAGDSAITLTLSAPASQILLWWPNGMGQQPLYNVSATWVGSGAPPPAAAPASTFRRLGFRLATLVTVNDTNATVVEASTGVNGNGFGFGMFFRVNGAALYARGGNIVPMEEMEGRMDGVGYATMVHSAADAHMNMFRVWGGGIFPPDAFYDTCDERGVLIYHDLMNARGNLPQDMPPEATASFLAEISHQARRLSPHPALVLYDSNNEDVVEPSGPTALYATLIMTALAGEDPSRILWPNSPSTGWKSGVDRLYGTPNGQPLVSYGGGHDYLAGQEWHRFYQAGVGAYNWSTVIRDPWTQAHTFDPGMPLSGLAPGSPTGPGYPSFFVSEFGSMSMSSFESMSGTLDPSSWGLHGGGKPETCTPQSGSFYNNCTGRNAMAQRNWACDNLVWSYFGPAYLNATGEQGFKGGLFQCMIAGALNMQTVVESHRSSNFYGTLEWQLNEVWPTGGWGSLEYGSPLSKGSLLGGRWKPLHYLFKNHLFLDVMSACGHSGGGRKQGNFVCYVNNARPMAGFQGTLTLTAIDLQGGGAAPSVWATFPVSVPPGPGAITWLTPNATLPNATTTLLFASLTETGVGTAFDQHIVHLTAPLNLALPRATLTATVAAQPNADGSVDIAVSTDAVALFVTLTAGAPGRFSDNAFLLLPGAPLTIQWLPFVPGGDAAANWALLKASLRIEDLSAYQVQQ